MESERWRLIWNISDVDRLVDFWIHTDQDHLGVLHHQSEEAAQSSLATGCGHDDHGLERRCRVSSQLQMTRPSIAATLLRLGFGVPYFNNFFLKGTIMKKKFILFPLVTQKPGRGTALSPPPLSGAVSEAKASTS